MALLFHADELYVGFGISVLICVAVSILLRGLVVRERRITNPTLKKLQGINRAQRRAERAKSRRARRSY